MAQAKLEISENREEAIQLEIEVSVRADKPLLYHSDSWTSQSLTPYVALYEFGFRPAT